MRYVGNKTRHAKQIIAAMDWTGITDYVEPFCGACGVISQVKGVNRYASDSNRYIVALLKAVQDGWIPPSDVTKEQYGAIKNDVDKYPDELVGFVGFGCSFGGKWFGGYAQGGTGSNGLPRDYAAESARNVLKLYANIHGITFDCLSYADRDYPNGSLIYCDIPYQDTTKYTGVGAFDHDQFWAWADEKVNQGYRVYVSEYNAPDNWSCVWSKEVISSLDLNTGSKKETEKLFTRSPSC